MSEDSLESCGDPVPLDQDTIDLIRGKRSAWFKAGDLLQWDIEAGKLTEDGQRMPSSTQTPGSRMIRSRVAS
jgi:hypothetical protein